MRHKGLKNLVLLFGLLIGLSTFGQNTLWQYNSPTALVYDPTSGPNGYVYFATEEGMLRALDTKGQPAWEVKPGGVIITPVVVAEDRLYFAVSMNELMGYGVDGKKVWSTNISAKPTGPLAVSGEKRIFLGTEDGYLYCVDGHGGAVIWKKKLGYTVGPPTISADGTVYCASENFLHGISQNGNIVWRENCFNYSEVPITVDSYDHLFYIRGGILDVYDKFGNILWEAYDDKGKLLEFETRPAVIYGDSAILVLQGAGDIISLDVFSGATNWRFTKTCDNSKNTWSPAIEGIPAIDSWGYGMWCDTEGTIVYFDATCGNELGWHPTVEGYMGTSPLLIGRNTGGLVIAASGQQRKSIIAFTHWAGPAGGPWSQWLGNPARLQRRDDAPMILLERPFQDEDIIPPYIIVKSSAADDFGLKSMELFINDDFIMKTTQESLITSIDASNFQDGVYTVSVVARDYAGNQTIAEANVNVQTPVPVYGLYSTPPLFSWLPNSQDVKYQVNISPDPSFYYVLASSATPERGYTKMLSWSPSKKKWKKIIKYAISQPSTQTTFYWRAVGKYGGEVNYKAFVIDKTK